MNDPVSSQLLLITAAMFLVFLNGFFVAAEFAIVKIRATRIDELIQKGSGGALRARVLVENLDEYLSASQLGISLSDQENDTIGGHVMTILGRTAELGDEVEIAGEFKVRVVGMKHLQITGLSVEPSGD